MSNSDQRERGERRSEWIVKALGALGFSEVKARWRLERWRKGWQRWRRRAEVRGEQVRYRHTACPGCGAVNDREAGVCGSCGDKLPSRALVVLDRMGVMAPSFLTISGLMGLAMALVYARVAIAARGEIVSLPVSLLVLHGAYMPEAPGMGEAWRALTAVFLHAGLWHLGFNLLSLAVIGPQVEQLYGRMATAAIFVTTGVLGFVGGGLFVGAVTIGASGAVMGLIGVAAGWGHREGTTMGRHLRNDMLKWLIYVTVFGLFVGANHGAHLVGFGVGAAIGYGVRPRWVTVAGRPYAMALGIAALATSAVAVFLTLVPPASPLQRAIAPDERQQIEDDLVRWREIVDVCQRYRAGDPAARANLRERLDSGDDLDGPCRVVDSVADKCSERAPADWSDESRAAFYRVCKVMREAR